MKWDLDRNLFTQIGLDSGALTILGSVVHSFQEPGVYRGSVHRPDGGQAVFYIDVDKESPAASVTIDLATLPGYTTPQLSGGAGAQEDDCCCGEGGKENRFSVNPKGYVLFRVSQGPGGHSVHVRRAREDQRSGGRTDDDRLGAGREERVFNSQQLGEGDVFAASIIRPGAYKVANSGGRGQGVVVVSYPQVGKEPYRPPEAVRVQVTREGMVPQRVELKPGQGLIFDIVQGPARIVVALTKPDDGPGERRKARPRGWTKQPLLAQAAREEDSGAKGKA